MFPVAPFPGVSGTSRRSSRCARCPISRGFWNMAVERAPDTDSLPITSCRGRFPLESLEFQALPHSLTNLISPYTASTSQRASRGPRRIRGATSALPYAAFRRGRQPRHTRSPSPAPAREATGERRPNTSSMKSLSWDYVRRSRPPRLPVDRVYEVGRDGIGEATRAHEARPPGWPGAACVHPLGPLAGWAAYARLGRAVALAARPRRAPSVRHVGSAREQ